MGKKDKSRVNAVPPGFLEKYRRRSGEDAVYLPLTTGFLRLEYDTEGTPLLCRVAFAAAPSKNSRAIGSLLELSLGPGGDGDTVTYIAEESVSGLQWSGGRAIWGHTYDDDSPAGEGEKIGLGAWIDRCVGEMINPPNEVLGDIKKRYDPAKDMSSIKAGDEKARDRFWKKCSPATAEETDLVLELVRFGANTGDGDILFTCGDLQEILAAHNVAADGAMARRWVELCKKSLGEKGPEALHNINEGSLIVALAGVPSQDEDVRKFLRELLDRVETASPDVRDDVWGLHSYHAVKKAVAKR